MSSPETALRHVVHDTPGYPLAGDDPAYSPYSRSRPFRPCLTPLLDKIFELLTC